MRTASVLGALILIAGCAAEQRDRTPEIAAIANNYVSYGRVDDLRRWAPTLCRAPKLPGPKISASSDEATHGRKLYYLFAKDREAYVHAQDHSQPLGQVLVKESWVPGAASTAANPVTGERGPLFLMMKTGEPDSDDGWIYATVTPDGKTVTASGKIASCMECHQANTRDRMFGVFSTGAGK